MFLRNCIFAITVFLEVSVADGGAMSFSYPIQAFLEGEIQGDRIVINTCLRNSSKKSVELGRSAIANDGIIISPIFEIDNLSSNEPVKFEGIQAKTDTLTRTHKVLEPGERYCFLVNLDDYYDLVQGGKFRITYSVTEFSEEAGDLVRIVSNNIIVERVKAVGSGLAVDIIENC